MNGKSALSLTTFGGPCTATLEMFVPRSPARLSDSAPRVIAASQEALGSMAEIIWAMNPRHDTLLCLSSYVRVFIADYLEPTRIRLLIDWPAQIPERSVSGEARHNIWLLVKQTLANAVEHSRATEISCRAVYEKSRFLLIIADNGQGSDLSLALRSGHGNGLANMRERMTSIGGRLDLCSFPGHGTEICLELNLKA